MLLLDEFVKVELLQKVLLISIFVLIMTNLLLFLLLFFQKLYIEQKNSKLQKLKEFYSKEIIEIISNKESKINLNKNIQYQAFSEIASEVLSSISGEFGNKILKILNDSGAIHYYLKKTNSKIWFKRIEAIEILESFKISSLEEKFFHLLKKEKNLSVKTQILHALSLICNKNSLRPLLDEIIKIEISSGKFLESIFSNIIQSLRQKNEEIFFIELLKNIKNDSTIPEQIKKIMIESCGTSMSILSKNVILDYFDTFQDNPYMQITCIRSLGKMSVPEICNIIEKALYAKQWEVKAVACKYAFLCPNLYPILVKLLEDNNFYVRKNAALSLSDSNEGLKNLKEKLLNTSDKYTKELINLILKLRLKNA